MMDGQHAAVMVMFVEPSFASASRASPIGLTTYLHSPLTAHRSPSDPQLLSHSLPFVLHASCFMLPTLPKGTQLSSTLKKGMALHEFNSSQRIKQLNDIDKVDIQYSKVSPGLCTNARHRILRDYFNRRVWLSKLSPTLPHHVRLVPGPQHSSSTRTPSRQRRRNTSLYSHQLTSD